MLNFQLQILPTEFSFSTNDIFLFVTLKKPKTYKIYYNKTIVMKIHFAFPSNKAFNANDPSDSVNE